MFHNSKNKIILIWTGLSLIALLSGIFGIRQIFYHRDSPLSIPRSHLDPNDWMAAQRYYPYGRINPEAYREAIGQAEVLMKAGERKDNPWIFNGPDNIGGRITDIECPPGQTSTVYVGAATGGILKTTDGGATWINLFGQVPVISVGDIAIDPDNPQVIYCGTGEANSSSYSFLGNGIYRSADGGETWQNLGLTNSAYIGRVVVDYSDSQRLFVAACGYLFTTNDERGIYRSTDGGGTWERVLFVTDSTSGIDIVQHPTNPQILYAAMWERSRGLTYRNSFGNSSGLWKSTDGGDTWSELTTGLPTNSTVGRIGIAIARSNPDILYAFYDFPDSEVGVYKTTNGGLSWTRTNDGTLYGMNSNFGWYFGQVRVDPLNPNRIFVMGVYLYKSENGGTSWTESGSWEMHVDHHAMYIDNMSGKIIEGNDGGLYTSTNHGSSWTKINNTPLTQFYAIDIDYLKPYRIYGGTQDNNTIRTLTGGTSDWNAILGGDGMYTLVDYTNSNTLYAESQWGNLNRSTDGGNNMTPINGPMSGDRVNWSAPLAMHPANPSILYFGTYRVWKTTNKGNTWTAMSGDLTAGINNYFYTVTTLAVSSVNPAVVIAGTGDGKVHVSVNNGQTWTNVSAGLPNRWVTRVAADPFSGTTIYATLSGFRWDEPLPHVFKSTDLGQNWTDITGNLPALPVNDLVLDPDLPDRIIVATDAGLYGTSDGGSTWSWVWGDLPAVPVCALKIHEPSREIVAGTYGLSCYRASLDNILTGVSGPGARVTIGVTVSPNPVKDRMNIRFFNPSDDRIVIRLTSLDGKLFHILSSKVMMKGEQDIVIHTGDADLLSGMYLLTVEGTKSRGSEKILIF